VAGFLFVVHGTQKLLGVPAPPPGGTFPVETLMGAAGLIESVGGALLLVGLLTRPIAFLMSGEMAFAYFMQHAPRDFWPLLNGGELAALYCFLFLYFAAVGAGPWSVDAWIARRRLHGGHHPLEPVHADMR
jgi:putative oxidoreductase